MSRKLAAKNTVSGFNGEKQICCRFCPQGIATKLVEDDETKELFGLCDKHFISYVMVTDKVAYTDAELGIEPVVIPDEPTVS